MDTFFISGHHSIISAIKNKNRIKKKLLLSKENLVGIGGYFARNTVPEGWLKCNGANISRTTDTALSNAIGTSFGSGDASTFGIPDLRGKFIRGWDDGRGIDSGRSFGNTQISSTKLQTSF